MMANLLVFTSLLTIFCFSLSAGEEAAPYFTVEPERIGAAEGETVELRCEAAGEPVPEIKWIHDGKPIEEAPPNPRRHVNSNRIRIERLTKNDTGNYGCNATNSIGYVYKDISVNVLASPPEIIEAPQDKQAVDGRNVTMRCKVVGAPKPVVRWVFNDRDLTGGRYSIQENGDLLIVRVHFYDLGDYTCTANNKFGRATAKARLIVKAHTFITHAPEDQEVAVRTSARFRCSAVADESLPFEILWLKNGKPIDLEGEPRLVRSPDYSLTITETVESDSGTYTCLAKAPLDEASATAQLIVQSVPNRPNSQGVECNRNYATIKWEPTGDNRAPITHFIVEYNTSFTPETWNVTNSHVPADSMTYTVAMSPWADYTFRVIAANKIGKSLPSSHSEVCTTEPDVPYKNPDHVRGEGDRPDNLVITWTPMPEIEHNGPKFQYRVSWKREIDGENYTDVYITDWRTQRYVVDDLQTFQRYRIKVSAMNQYGEANVSPDEVVGFSGESTPEQAPKNFTLVEVLGPRTALLGWNPVDGDSVRGHLRGYKIETWSDVSPSHKEVRVQGHATEALVNVLDPSAKNYAQVFVYNDKYDGPPSETLSFITPEDVPEDSLARTGDR